MPQHRARKTYSRWRWLPAVAALVLVGSSAIVLTTQLRRALDIAQGKGSQILTRPGPSDTVEVGGRVILDETRPL